MGYGKLKPIAAPDSACCPPGCCEPTGVAPTAPALDAPAPNAPAADTRALVREGYGAIAEAGSWNAHKQAAMETTGACAPGGGCCGPSTLDAEQLALAIGYAAGELAALPAGVNLGLSCGNPGALAALRPGESVLDLGCGAGLDAFLAGPRVGSNGRVIGVDMTPRMLEKARANLATYRASSQLDNVEFRLGEIENLPLADASVDVVISNCVLNLSPDKARVWKEIARVLKPGGRVAISDIVLLRPLPEALRTDVEALVGCVAGASLVDDVRRMAEAAGLTDVRLEPKAQYVEALSNSGDPLYAKVQSALPAGLGPADYVSSAQISARKR
jgi:SAM-dependent methyltransferase